MPDLPALSIENRLSAVAGCHEAGVLILCRGGTMTNRYSQLVAPQRSEVIEEPAPEPGPDQILVRVTACGVCASGLHPGQLAQADADLRDKPDGFLKAVVIP